MWLFLWLFPVPGYALSTILDDMGTDTSLISSVPEAGSAQILPRRGVHFSPFLLILCVKHHFQGIVYMQTSPKVRIALPTAPRHRSVPGSQRGCRRHT